TKMRDELAARAAAGEGRQALLDEILPVLVDTGAPGGAGREDPPGRVRDRAARRAGRCSRALRGLRGGR
ncbi:hypothetical protein ACWEWX_54395, partial [Streptomyces asiaticus]